MTNVLLDAMNCALPDFEPEKQVPCGRLMCSREALYDTVVVKYVLITIPNEDGSCGVEEHFFFFQTSQLRRSESPSVAI